MRLHLFSWDASKDSCIMVKWFLVTYETTNKAWGQSSLVFWAGTANNWANMTPIPINIKIHHSMVWGLYRWKRDRRWWLIRVQRSTFSQFKHASHSPKVAETYIFTKWFKTCLQIAPKLMFYVFVCHSKKTYLMYGIPKNKTKILGCFLPNYCVLRIM